MRQREGYLLVDHSASPGLPESVARASGYDPLFCKEGKKFEAATLTCAHCKASVVKNSFRTRPRATCMKCSGKYICDLCAFKASLPDYIHTPYERYIDNSVDMGERGIIIDHENLIFGRPHQPISPLLNLKES